MEVTIPANALQSHALKSASPDGIFSCCVEGFAGSSLKGCGLSISSIFHFATISIHPIVHCQSPNLRMQLAKLYWHLHLELQIPFLELRDQIIIDLSCDEFQDQIVYSFQLMYQPGIPCQLWRIGSLLASRDQSHPRPQFQVASMWIRWSRWSLICASQTTQLLVEQIELSLEQSSPSLLEFLHWFVSKRRRANAHQDKNRKNEPAVWFVQCQLSNLCRFTIYMNEQCQQQIAKTYNYWMGRKKNHPGNGMQENCASVSVLSQSRNC